MKKQILMSLIFLIGIFLAEQKVIAQASNKSKRQLHINKKGEIRDDHGATLGYINKEDIVYNNEGEKLGFIENGKVYDAQGNPLGKAKKNGKYYNNQGINILTVKGNDDMCEILDPEGHKLGTVHKNYKLHACATHCFFLKQKQDKNGVQ
jgi:hypothetical protein